MEMVSLLLPQLKPRGAIFKAIMQNDHFQFSGQLFPASSLQQRLQHSNGRVGSKLKGCSANARKAHLFCWCYRKTHSMTLKLKYHWTKYNMWLPYQHHLEFLKASYIMCVFVCVCAASILISTVAGPIHISTESIVVEVNKKMNQFGLQDREQLCKSLLQWEEER